MSKTPLISVIICTFNTKELTSRCLDNLKESIDNLDKQVEVIVVENGNDGTGMFVKKNYPWVNLIEPNENTGFAKGNNLGIEKADKKTSYFLFLNTDALVRKDTLKISLRYMENNSNCDVLGCKLILGDGKMQNSAGYLPKPFSVFTWIWGLDLIPFINKFLKPVHPKNASFFKNDKKVGWVMGAYLFMRKEVVSKTKGFDEKFFMYMEEVEWCKRINDLGYNIYYTPRFSIIHLDKASSKNNPQKLKKIYVNEILGVIYFLKKYYKNSVFLLRQLVKIGLCLRVLAFKMTGNQLRKAAYGEALEKL